MCVSLLASFAAGLVDFLVVLLAGFFSAFASGSASGFVIAEWLSGILRLAFLIVC